MRSVVFILYLAMLITGCGGEPSDPVVISASQPEQEPAAESLSPPKLERIGTGLLPDGLSGTDLNSVRKLRIKALEDSITGLRQRFEGGLDGVRPVLEAQIELANARLEMATTKKERLDAIADCQEKALLIWQRLKELERVGARGGDLASESTARSYVFRIREMWLKESASKNP